ncbi:hypothetical protein BZA05DRAFT_398178 [Tricharina praecox]|uniref:uncharacterized protein n=1 Tax=Tricharina praecox TaxID=43433 RepID=UPI002220811E|nr:uncharacterized protein BZA05DRAFT_398178 [Tricharina praecox]KAI5851901.1 hypothetical protein BZA05DRAFT_398178 [Tricharina praecox]
MRCARCVRAFLSCLLLPFILLRLRLLHHATHSLTHSFAHALMHSSSPTTTTTPARPACLLTNKPSERANVFSEANWQHFFSPPHKQRLLAETKVI